MDARNSAPLNSDAIPGSSSWPASVRNSLARLRHTRPRRNGNASRVGSSMLHTIGDTSARLYFSAHASRVASTLASCACPSSSASHTQSAPCASACSMPSAKPPAPPRFRRDPKYVVAIGCPATSSRTGLSPQPSLSTTIRWSGNRVWAVSTSSDLASSSGRRWVTTTAKTDSVIPGRSVCRPGSRPVLRARAGRRPHPRRPVPPLRYHRRA
ncbi:Uncharacterised protein [Mycobacterium tuberculosis]|nr:Uncharacterised protein [Mycobacterium tuberculosis]CKS69414.1 Uncharacterised protein [Mycobacterium tuberculosis]